MSIPERYLKESEWSELIKSGSFELVTSFSPILFRRIDEKRSVLYELESTPGVNVSNDGHVWSFSNSKTGFRHRPMYKKMSIDGESVHVTQCTDYYNTDFKKDVLKHHGKFFVHYFLSSGSYRKHESECTKEARINDDQKEQIRKLLKNRTVADAYKMAKEQGMNVTRLQIKNQSKYVPDVKKGLTGPRMQVTTEILKELQESYPECVEFSVDKNVLSFRIAMCFEKPIKTYLSSCPQKHELQQWKEDIDRILLNTLEEKKLNVAKVINENAGGIFFPNRLFVDTTFNVCGCYVTLLLGEIPKFQTKSSEKNRVILLGWMVHTGKSTENHIFFSEKLKTAFLDAGLDFGYPAVPCIVLDGETSLLQYSEKLVAPIIRCDFHLLSLLIHKFGNGAVEKSKDLIFGKMKNACWKRGILGSFDEHEFDQNVEAASNYMDSRISDWLKKNKIMLLESSSITAKLYSGHVMHYATTNISECNNGLMKTYIGNKKELKHLVQGLISFVEDNYKEIWMSASGQGETVIFRDHNKVSTSDFNERKLIFKKMGLPAPSVLSYKNPRDILHKLDINSLDIEEKSLLHLSLVSMSKNTALFEDDSAKEGTAEQTVLVKRIGKSMRCGECCSKTNSFFCRHVIATLNSLSDDEREMELIWIWDDLRKSKQEVPQVSRRAGHKKSDRIGSRSSKLNHKREVLNNSEMTLLKEDALNANSVLESMDITSFNQNRQSESDASSDDSMDTEVYLKRRRGNVSESSSSISSAECSGSKRSKTGHFNDGEIQNVKDSNKMSTKNDSLLTDQFIPIAFSTPTDESKNSKILPRKLRTMTLENFGFFSSSSSK